MSCIYQWHDPKIVAVMDVAAQLAFRVPGESDSARRRKLTNEVHDLVMHPRTVGLSASVAKELIVRRSAINLDYIHGDHWGITWPGVLGSSVLVYKRLGGSRDGEVVRVDRPHFYVFPPERIGNVPEPRDFVKALDLDLNKQGEHPAHTMFSLLYKNNFWRSHDFVQDHTIAMTILSTIILCNLDTKSDLFGMLPLEKIASDLATSTFTETQKASALSQVRSLRERIESVPCAAPQLVSGVRYFEDLIIPASIGL